MTLRTVVRVKAVLGRILNDYGHRPEALYVTPSEFAALMRDAQKGLRFPVPSHGLKIDGTLIRAVRP